jgi:ATP-binding cassette subfamily B protein
MVSSRPVAARPIAALWRLRPYLKPYRYQLITMIVCALASAASEIVIPLLIKAVIDGPIAHHDRGALLPLGVAAIALGAAIAVMNLIRRWIQGNAVADMEKTLRDDLYQHLQRLEPEFHDGWQSGQLLSRSTTDLSSIRKFAGFGIVFLITSVFTFAAVTVMLIRMNWWLGLLTGAMFIPVLAFCTKFEREYKVLSRRVQDQEGDLTTLVEEAATGVRVLKALGRAPEAAARHEAQARQVYRTQVAKARILGGFWSVLDLIPNAAIAVIVVFGALAVSHHALTLGGLVAFITLALQLVWPIEALGYIIASGEEAATAAQRVLEIFDRKSKIASAERPSALMPQAQAPVPEARTTGRSDQAMPARGDNPPNPPMRTRWQETPSYRARELPQADDSVTAPAARHAGYLRFEHVAFAYPGSPEPVLRDVDLGVARGETLVLTGATGSGKTTLLQLVPRLTDVTGGRILLGGTDLRDIPLPELRTAVGCAFEEATLFSASVRENVTFGAADACEEEIEAALHAAQAQFAYDLPWGLDTRIGEQGMALSGGQRQRVALARAILARPDVLILDDPLSALDVHTEERVTRALGSVLAGTTALVVAHRPSTVALADRVALLSGGKIAAVGSHHDLLTSVPAYRNLMSMEEVAS